MPPEVSIRRPDGHGPVTGRGNLPTVYHDFLLKKVWSVKNSYVAMDLLVHDSVELKLQGNITNIG